MLLTDISLWKKPIWEEALKYTTVRVDLPLFPFDGFDDPLMEHITLLYFLTPEFTNQLMKKKAKPVH